MTERIRTRQEIHEKLSELRRRLENAIKETRKSPATAMVVYAITREIIALEWVLGVSSWEGNVKF